MYSTKLMYFLYLLGVNKCYGYGHGYGYGVCTCMCVCVCVCVCVSVCIYYAQVTYISKAE